MTVMRQQCTKSWCENPAVDGSHCIGPHDDHTWFYWGRCRSGKRWFWHVHRFGNFQRGETEWTTGQWHGWTDTEADARQAVTDTVKGNANGYPVHLYMKHGVASEKLREVSREKRKARMAANPSKAKGVSNCGTLWAYHAYYGDMSDVPDRGWVEHRIIKVTKKYAWLACDGREYEGQLFKLDREALERDGHVWGGARWRDRNDYYTEAGKKAWELEKIKDHADWLKCRFHPLGEMPENYTKSDVLKAFRESSLVHHPDHGGDPEMFRKLVDMKERALQWLREREVHARSAAA